MSRGCCRIGESPNRVLIERLKEDGKSYRYIQELIKERFDEVIYNRSFTEHFSRHVSVDTADYIKKIRQNLEAELAVAPPTIAPLYAVALRNLEGLEETKASQEHLIRALKAIHEITGLQLQQRMLVTFAAARAAKRDAADSGGAEGEGTARVLPLSPVRRAE